MSLRPVVCVVGGIAIWTSGCGCALAQPTPGRSYQLDSLSVHAVRSQAQLRSGRITPLSVDIHDSGNGHETVDVECTLGTVTVTGSAPADSLRATATVFLKMPLGSAPSQVPPGRQHVSCRARVRGSAGAVPGGAIAVTNDLVIEPPTLPDFALSPYNLYNLLPSAAFDCDNYAPPIATRDTCVAFESRDLGATTASGAATIQCAVDGIHHKSPGPYHAGAFPLGRLGAGHHVLRCTTTAADPEWETDRSNNTLEVAFDVGDGSTWLYDLAIAEVDPSTRPTLVPPPPVGPPRDTPPLDVPGVKFGVRVRNVGGVRVFAVQVTCDARSAAGQTTTFQGIWARPARHTHDWLRGLDPGESAVVDVATPGSPPTGVLEVHCDARAAAPRDVPELHPHDNEWRGRISIP